jgi:hypothetical protein
LNAISGHVPIEMVQCIAAFLDACYLVRRTDIKENNITELQMAIRRFHEHRETFRVHGVQPNGFSLPCQHSLTHYPHQIHEFGAPGGLCSSITESQHITAVSDHGNGRTVTTLWGRCCSRTNTLTSSRWHAATSSIEGYSLLLMFPHQNPC